jgi:hypothetical protein
MCSPCARQETISGYGVSVRLEIGLASPGRKLMRGGAACVLRLAVVAGRSWPAPLPSSPPSGRTAPLSIGSAQATGSFFTAGRLSQRLPAATMQLIPLGVVLTTVQVSFSWEK